jgi:hypothetical protein
VGGATLLLGSRKAFSASNTDAFPAGGILLAEPFERFSQDRHRPPGIEDFLCRQKLDRLEPIALFGLFCIQLYKFLVSSSFKSASTINLIRKVVLERGEQERPVVDYKLPDGSGLDVAKRIRSKWGAAPIILISG